MLQRALSGIIFISLLIAAILYSSLTFHLLFFIFCLLAVYEFQKMAKISSPLLYALASVYFLFSEGTLYLVQGKSAFLEFYIQKYQHSAQYFILFSFFLISLFSKDIKKPFKYLGKIFITYIYAILPFTIITAIPYINETHSYDGQIILGCLILIWSTDTFAYLTGKAFGKRKLFKRISPKKTIEGSIGGVVMTLLIAYILSLNFTQHNLWAWLGLSLVVSVMGSIGDLIESMFKRAVKIKDSGNIIPGHGGILDRFDSLIYASPFIYYYLHLMY
ncbi:phosphatidate cytidylyltransferase [Ochrovirga pacifica]|uniref:phosphatidate cytidylyltransferase n=1 Tax=Ochrovirga pacifica TaxID=1042376 RepID=UPI000255A79C|nr:phosphatidate cytidylyltransferase [Ochrovirga pacifica]